MVPEDVMTTLKRSWPAASCFWPPPRPRPPSRRPPQIRRRQSRPRGGDGASGGPALARAEPFRVEGDNAFMSKAAMISSPMVALHMYRVT